MTETEMKNYIDILQELKKVEESAAECLKGLTELWQAYNVLLKQSEAHMTRLKDLKTLLFSLIEGELK